MFKRAHARTRARAHAHTRTRAHAFEWSRSTAFDRRSCDDRRLQQRCGGCTCDDACVQGGAERSWLPLCVTRITPSVTHQRQRCALIMAVAMRLHTCILQYLHLLHCVNPLFFLRRAGNQSAHKQLQQRLRTGTHAAGWPSQRARIHTQRASPILQPRPDQGSQNNGPCNKW